jgi:tungstate transport system permease protein
VGVFWDAIGQAFHLLVSGNSYVYQVMLMSLRVAGTATLIGLVLGIPLGTWLALKHFPGWGVVAAVLYTGLSLPPVVVGLFVYMLLSRQGPLGSLDALYTVTAMVIAEVIITTPVIGSITMAAVASVPKELRLQALGLGASGPQAVWLILREARVSLFAGIVAGFGAAISEVGAVMMVGGNLSIAGHNQTGTMTTAIMALARQGDYATAMALGVILLFLAFVITVVLIRTQVGLRHKWLQS